MFLFNHIFKFIKLKNFSLNYCKRWISLSSDVKENNFSTLYVSGKHGHKMYSILKPILNLEKFLDQDYVNNLKDNFEKRYGSTYLVNHFLNKNEFKNNLEKMLKLSKEREKVRIKVHVINENIDGYWDCENLNKDDLVSKLNSLTHEYYDLEEKIIPLILQLPNLISDSTPKNQDKILQTINSNPFDFKPLDYVKLSYINKCVYPSIVGPNSIYLTGDGAKLYYALKRYFSQHLQSKQFILFSGIDFVKSGILEASYSLMTKYDQDPLLLKAKGNSSFKNQMLHFVGDGSFEALSAFLSRRDINLKNLPIKLMSIGANYTRDLVQQDTIRCLLVVKDDFKESQKEMDLLCQDIWKWFEQLKIPIRLIKVGSSRLKKHEYFKYEIETWLPSSSSWKCISFLSHYGNLVPRLFSLDQIQFIDAFVFDSKTLIDSIIENNQNENGSFQIPSILKNYLTPKFSQN